MRATLTVIEEQVYHFLLDHLAEHTFQPSVRDIAKACRIASTKSVTDLLASLEEKGYLEREHGRSRGVKLLGYAGPGGVVPVPVMTVRDGRLVATAHLSVDRTLVPSDDCFFVRAADSAPGAGILAGDFVMAHPVARAAEAATVVARVGGAVVVRTLKRQGQVVVLIDGEGAATELGPQDDYAVLGVLAAVVRGPAIASGDAATA